MLSGYRAWGLAAVLAVLLALGAGCAGGTEVPAATATPAPSNTVAPAATPAPVATVAPTATPASAVWRGLTIAPEERCSPYDADDYRYSPSVEASIVDSMGGVYGPYTGTWFGNTGETDIEHIVARSEAHDSGLCAADSQTRKQFATDPLNLTLAAPGVNRHQKSDKDAAEWLPDLNQCWFADRVVEVRQKYGLSIDLAEAEAIDRVLDNCASTAMVVQPTPAPAATNTPAPMATATPAPEPAPTQTKAVEDNALALYDDNGNGRITCAEARNHGIAPVHRGHPAYQYMRDADGDGVICE